MVGDGERACGFDETLGRHDSSQFKDIIPPVEQHILRANAGISVLIYFRQNQNHVSQKLRDITSPLFMVFMRIEFATCVALKKIQLF